MFENLRLLDYSGGFRLSCRLARDNFHFTRAAWFLVDRVLEEEREGKIDTSKFF